MTNCAIGALNWLWEGDPTLSGGNWSAADLAALLNWDTKDYARSASAAGTDTVIDIAFPTARRIDTVLIGFHNGSAASRFRILAGPPPFEWDFRTGALPAGMEAGRSGYEASWWGPDGAMHWIGTEGPRFHFEPLTGACLGLLLEGAQNNLLEWSEDLTEWTPTNVTIDADAAVAPDGEADMAKVEETNANGAHGVELAHDWQYALPQIVSGHAEADERSWLCVRLYDGTNAAYAWFDIANGTVGHLSAGLSEARLEPLPNGRCRWSVKWTPAAAVGSIGLWLATAEGGDAVQTYAGTNGYGLLPWGMQVELAGNVGGGPRPSSYIRTAGESGVRTADFARLDGADLTAVVPADATELTFGVELRSWTAGATAGTHHAFALIDDGGSNMVYLAAQPGSGSFQGNVLAGAPVMSEVVGSYVGDGTPAVAVIAIAPNDGRFAAAGALSAADTSVALPPRTQMVLASAIPRTITRVLLGPRRVGDATLQAGSASYPALGDGWPGVVLPWTALVPTTHVPVGGFIPFGRPSDGKLPDDERDPRGASRIVFLDAPIEIQSCAVQFDDPDNPAGYLQLSILWMGMSARADCTTDDGFVIGAVEESRRKRSRGGTLRARSLWKRMRVAGGIRWQEEDVGLGQWLEMQKKIGATRPILFSLFPRQAGVHQDRLTLVGVLEEPTPVEHASPNFWGWPFAIVSL